MPGTVPGLGTSEAAQSCGGARCSAVGSGGVGFRPAARHSVPYRNALRVSVARIFRLCQDVCGAGSQGLF